MYEGQRPSYGWTVLRIDVEQGVTTKVEIVDSSPKGLFDDEARAIYAGMRYAPSVSAKNCYVHHKWD